MPSTIKSSQYVGKEVVNIECQDGATFSVSRRSIKKEQLLRVDKEMKALNDDFEKYKAGGQAAIIENSDKLIEKLLAALNILIDDGANGDNLRKFLDEFGIDFVSMTKFTEDLATKLIGDKK